MLQVWSTICSYWMRFLIFWCRTSFRPNIENIVYVYYGPLGIFMGHVCDGPLGICMGEHRDLGPFWITFIKSEILGWAWSYYKSIASHSRPATFVCTFAQPKSTPLSYYRFTFWHRAPVGYNQKQGLSHVHSRFWSGMVIWPIFKESAYSAIFT